MKQLNPHCRVNRTGFMQNNNRKKVSVIIPVYNAGKYLAKCLDTVVNQTYKNLEIICVNDCSGDNSEKILKQYANRIKIIDHNEHKGVSCARNTGIEQATGEYIYFVDADDWIDSNYIEEMVKAAQKSDADITVNRNILTEFSDSRTLQYEHPLEKDIKLNSYLDISSDTHKIYWVVWNKIYKASFLKNIKFPEGYIMEDLYYHYITFARANKIFYTEEAVYHYTDREDSISKIQYDVGMSYIKIFSLVYDYYKKYNLLDKKIKIYTTFGCFNVKNEEIYNAYKEYFDKSVDYLNENKDIYNEMDLYFANNIANSADFKDYISKYPASAAISFIRRKIAVKN